MFPSLRILLSAGAGFALVLVLGIVVFFSRPREQYEMVARSEKA